MELPSWNAEKRTICCTAGERIIAMVSQAISRIALEKSEQSYRAALIYFFNRARTTYEAIILLSQNGLPEEVAIMFRTLFEIELQVNYLHKDPEKRSKQFAPLPAKLDQFQAVTRACCDRTSPGVRYPSVECNRCVEYHIVHIT